MWLQAGLNHLIPQVYHIISHQTLWRLRHRRLKSCPRDKLLPAATEPCNHRTPEKKRLKGMRVYFDLQFTESGVHWSREDRERLSTHTEASESGRGSGRGLFNPQPYSGLAPPMLWLQRLHNSATVWEPDTQPFHIQPVWKEGMVVTLSGVTNREANSYLELPRFS